MKAKLLIPGPDDEAIGVIVDAETPDEQAVLLRLFCNGAKVNAIESNGRWLQITFLDLTMARERRTR